MNKNHVSLPIDLLIIGAGPAGLAFADEYQHPHMILEQGTQLGGLCRSYENNEAVFDIGGHSFHTPIPEVHAKVEAWLGTPLETQQRNAKVFSHGTLIPYPFQKNYDKINNPSVVEDCRRGLESASNGQDSVNFEEWIIQRFGEGIAKHFMLPYNRKLWARDLKTINSQWVGERVAAPKGEKQHFDTQGGKRKPLQADTSVGYPPQGGFSTIFEAAAKFAGEISYNKKVTSIDVEKKELKTASHDSYQWHQLVSTMPIPELLNCIQSLPDNILALGQRLQSMSLQLLMLQIDGPIGNVPQRIYVADPNIPPHKIAFNHTSSSSLRQRSVHAIMAETSYSVHKSKLSPKQLRDDTVVFLADNKLIPSPESVIDVDILDIRYAYPVQTLDYERIVSDIKTYLAQYQIHTLGRFGEWAYVNSDECIQRGMLLARKLNNAS